MIIGSKYTFSIVTQIKGQDTPSRVEYTLTAKNGDIAIATISVFRSQKHPNSGIVFSKRDNLGVHMHDLITGQSTPERARKYLTFLKANESDIMATMKTIRKI